MSNLRKSEGFGLESKIPDFYTTLFQVYIACIGLMKMNTSACSNLDVLAVKRRSKYRGVVVITSQDEFLGHIGGGRKGRGDGLKLLTPR